MELRHLRYFAAVAEELNFTRAAARLRVAQPALSSQIKDLENELETTLFERGHAGVRLTRAGKVFYQRARNILAEAAQAAHEARTAGDAVTGKLVVGFPSGLHLNYLKPLLDAFRRENPKVDYDYSHGLPRQQLKGLEEGLMDIGFLNLPLAAGGMDYQVVWRIPFEVVLPKKHPLAKRGNFKLADLQGEDFIFCTRESRPEFYDDFYRHCANAGFRPRVVKEVGGYPSNMLGLVSVGAGISVLPHFQGVERIQGIVWRELAQPRLWTDWALVWRREKASQLVKAFVAAAEKIYGKPAESERADI